MIGSTGSLSIIIVHFNTYVLTRECLMSIAKYIPSNLSFEVIIVVNGEEDQSVDSLDLEFFFVKIIKLEKNIGFAKANNEGIKKAKYGNFLLLNSDTVIVEDIFTPCLNLLNSDNKLIITPRLVNSIEGPTQVSYCPMPELRMELIFTFYLHKLLGRKYLIKKGYLFCEDISGYKDNCYCVATVMFFHKSALSAFPENRLYDDMFLYGEEIYWGYFLNKAGFKTFYKSDSKIVHLIGKSDINTKDFAKTERRRFLQTIEEINFLKFSRSIIVVYLIVGLRLIRWSINMKDADIRLRLRCLLKVVKYNLVSGRNYVC